MNGLDSREVGQPVASRTKWWVLLAVALYLVQVLPYLSHRWVTDESWYAAPGYSVAQGQGLKDPAIGPNDNEHNFDARPPGTALTIAAADKLLGVGQIAGRLGSVIAGLLIVLLTWRVARQVIGEEGAVFAMLVVATDNLLVLGSRTARPEALTVLCVMLGLLAMARYLRSPSLVWPVLSGLAMALGTMFHITLLGYIVSFALLAIAEDMRRKAFPLRGFAAYSAGYLAGLVPFAVWILRAPLGLVGFHEEYLGRAGQPWVEKIEGELHRYDDVFGIGLLHGNGLSSLPLRLPIPLLFLVALFLLWRYQRDWFRTALLLWIPTALWLVYTVNKSSRYVALLAPVFALAIGAAVAAVRSRRTTYRLVAGWAVLVIVAQFGANLVLLRQARKADYNLVARELESAIPAGETAYGTITFWLALYDHPFISYERTDPHVALEQDHVHYYILGDRMMTNGSKTDGEYYVKINAELRNVVAHCDLIAEFPDPYYGDLKVYKLRQ